MIIYYLLVNHSLEFQRIVIEVLTVLSGILLNVDNEIIPRDKKMIYRTQDQSSLNFHVFWASCYGRKRKKLKTKNKQCGQMHFLKYTYSVIEHWSDVSVNILTSALQSSSEPKT